MKNEKIAIFPGSYDPVTNGHIDIIKRGTKLFDKIIVAALKNPSKTYLFSLQERLKILQTIFSDKTNIQVDYFEGLLVDYIKKKKATVVVRGLRAISDFEIEFQMALMNRKLSPDCETLFLMPKAEYSFVSSTMIREIARFDGDISLFVPPRVANELTARMQELSW